MNISYVYGWFVCVFMRKYVSGSACVNSISNDLHALFVSALAQQFVCSYVLAFACVAFVLLCDVMCIILMFDHTNAEYIVREYIW